LVGHVILVYAGDAGDDAVVQPLVAHRTREVLLLREQVADGLVELGARLQDAHACHLERKVVPESAFDELIEDRVVEVLPPVFLRDAVGPIRDRRAVLPMEGDVGVWRLVVRPHLAGTRKHRERHHEDRQGRFPAGIESCENVDAYVSHKDVSRQARIRKSTY
jgi:hypothetical protein